MVSTAVAAGVAWWAVSAAGAPGEAPDVLSEAQVAGALAAERDALAAAADTATPGPTTSAGPTASPEPTGPTTAPDAAPVVRTWSTDGGTVSAACTGDAVSIEYATPASGWRVDVKERGPGARVLVELERDGTETYVQAVCVDGTPEFSLVAGDSGEDHRGGGSEPEGEDD
ncbi:hypothetical protein AFE02nite_28650 [Actinotalea fermentans]|uniref:Uncharacterized protein n=1 Tax=Actinotalea fermentans TaxID=43671 RepID=A0A511Z0Z4_9CELL|nr:hypothetical protein AFE02nite_28650 [Actinotalea fermentans]